MIGMDIDGGRLRQRAVRVWLVVGVVVLTWITWELASPILAVVVPPIVLAIIITYLLNPLVNALAGSGGHRFVGTALTYCIVAAVITVPAIIGLPLLSEQATSIWEQAPETINTFLGETEAWLDSRGLGLGLDTRLDPEAIPTVDSIVNDEEGRSVIAAVLGGLSGFATGLLRLLLIALLGPVIAFYVLVDLPRLRRWTMRHIPPHHRAESAVVGRKLSGVIGGYLRGQLLVALFVGSAVSLGMWLIDLPYWLVVGIVAGTTNLVPLLGPFVAGVLGASIALANGGVGFALLVVAVLTVVQQVDNHLVSPLVMGQSVRLHPLAVLLALLVGGTLYGFLGLLMAVPVVAASRVIANHLWMTRVPWASADVPDDVEVELDAGALASGMVGDRSNASPADAG